MADTTMPFGLAAMLMGPRPADRADTTGTAFDDRPWLGRQLGIGTSAHDLTPQPRNSLDDPNAEAAAHWRYTPGSPWEASKGAQRAEAILGAPGVNEMLFASNFLAPRPGAPMLSAPAPKPQGIRAHHGSPPQAYYDQLGFPPNNGVSKLADDFKNALAQSQQRFPVSSEAEAYLHKWGNDPEKARRYIADDIRSFDGRHPELHKIHSELMDPRLDAVYASRKKASSESIALEKELDMADRSHRLNMAAGQERHPDAEHKVYHGSPDQFQTFDTAIARSKSESARDAQVDMAFVSPSRKFAEKFGPSRDLTLKEGKYFDPWNDIDLAAIASYVNSKPNSSRIWSKIDSSGNGNVNSWGHLEQPDYIREMQRLGYDGVRMMEDGSPAYGVWTKNKLFNPDGSRFFGVAGAGLGLAAAKPGDQQ